MLFTNLNFLIHISLILLGYNSKLSRSIEILRIQIHLPKVLRIQLRLPKVLRIQIHLPKVLRIQIHLPKVLRIQIHLQNFK